MAASLLFERTPNHHMRLGNGQIPRTRQNKSRWQRTEVRDSGAVGRADRPTQPKKPPPAKKLRDAFTQTEEPKSALGRSDVFTQTDPGHATVDVGCQVDANTMETATLVAPGISVGEVATVPEVALPPKSVAVKSAANSTDEDNTICRSLKLWKNRFSLFSRFELGVMLDEGSFYSMCPEVVAAHMASRCAYGTVVDPFCGAGGIAIQLALTCRKVIAVDIDPVRIKLARENASVYGVGCRIDFRVGDSYKILAEVKADAVVTSPPWVGRFHAKDIGSEKEWGMAGVLKMAHKIAPRVVLHLPKTIDRTQCLRVSRKAKFGRVEFEDVIIDECTNSMNMYLKSRQNNSPLGPAITSSVNLKFPKNHRKKRNNGLGYYVSYLNRTKTFLATQ